MRHAGFACVTVAVAALAAGSAVWAAEGPNMEKQEWSYDGIFGRYDHAAAQRGFAVYNDVCSACHSLRLLHYRDLEKIGFTEEQIEDIGAVKSVVDGPNELGEMFDRPARPNDSFVSPFPNDVLARLANNGALPPDLSLIVKARPGGADYIYAFLTGFEDPPADFNLTPGLNYNTAFHGNQVAMPPVLVDDMVTYADGTKATVPQMSHDVVTFLAWAAEPEMEPRKELGLKVMLFLGLLTAMLYAVKRKVWKKLH